MIASYRFSNLWFPGSGFMVLEADKERLVESAQPPLPVQLAVAESRNSATKQKFLILSVNWNKITIQLFNMQTKVFRVLFWNPDSGCFSLSHIFILKPLTTYYFLCISNFQILWIKIQLLRIQRMKRRSCQKLFPNFKSIWDECVRERAARELHKLTSFNVSILSASSLDISCFWLGQHP